MQRLCWLVVLTGPSEDNDRDQLYVWATTPAKASIVALGTRPDGWSVVGEPEEFVAPEEPAIAGG